MEQYTLGLFSNMYPIEKMQQCKKKVHDDPYRGIFIKRMVQKLEAKGVLVKKAVKRESALLGYIPFYAKSVHLSFDPTIDILQTHYIPHSSIIPALLKHRKPLVLKFHGDDGRVYPFANKFNRLITRLMIKRSDHIISTSKEIRGKLIELGALPDHISAISSGVDTDFFRPTNPEISKTLYGLPVDNTPIFLYVGRIHPWKGIYEIISAAHEHPDSLFVFAGPGTIPAYPDNCRFLRELPPEKIPALINAADVALLPSYTEGISNFIMESLSCEVPVISTNVGGNPEIVKHNDTGLLVPPRNVSALSQAISWMKKHENERKSMGKRGRVEMITQYNDDLLINRMIEIHHRLLK
jgi:teichuronic acid biosynthesis glycosyltransferase TuaC